MRVHEDFGDRTWQLACSLIALSQDTSRCASGGIKDQERGCAGCARTVHIKLPNFGTSSVCFVFVLGPGNQSLESQPGPI
jgi:hypothetical protein